MHKIKIYLSFASYYCPSSCCEQFAESQISALIRWHRKGTGFFISYNNPST